MIWTDEENEIRELDNMINHTVETCKDCQWSNWEFGQKFFTCGHHLSNLHILAGAVIGQIIMTRK